MGKSRRKINRLRRKFLKRKLTPRIPVAPPGFSMKSKKDYDRNKHKQETKKMANDER
jgi:hypothetical protein